MCGYERPYSSLPNCGFNPNEIGHICKNKRPIYEGNTGAAPMGNILLITFYILTSITFFVTKKRMHLYEIIFCWLVVVLLHDYFFMIVTVNYKWVIPSPLLSDVFLRIGYQHIIAPIIVIFALEWWRLKRGLLHKLLSIVFFTIVFMALKRYLFYLGVVTYSSAWKEWWSYLETIMLFSITGITLVVFRWIMRKDGIAI